MFRMLSYIPISVFTDSSKKFLPLIITLQYFISTFTRKYPLCAVLTTLSLNDKNVYLLPENLDPLSNLNIGFVSALSL